MYMDCIAFHHGLVERGIHADDDASDTYITVFAAAAGPASVIAVVRL